MRRPIIRITAVAVVTLLCGAAGAVVGREVAPPDAAAGLEDSAGTVSVPVLGPVGRGDAPPVHPVELEPASAPAPGADHVPPPAPDPSTEPPSSPVLGHVELPADADGAPDLGAALLATAERLAETDDDVPEILVLDTGDRSEGDAGHAHDVCALVDGDADTECPDGLRGEVFGLSVEHLWLYGSDSVHEPSDEHPPYAVQCPPVETAADAMPFGFAASAPGTVEMTYGPYGTDRTTTIQLTLTAEQVADWEARMAATPEDAVWRPAVYFCTVLAGLEKHTSYTFTATITDAHGATASSAGHFRLPEDRVRPPAEIRPLGDGALYTALAHKPGDEVRITYRVLEDGEAPDCALPGHRLQTPFGRNYAVPATPLTEEYLAAHGYLPGYTERKAWITTVPEGSTVLVCFSEHAQNRPTWQWHDAQWRTWAVVATPDYARPSVIADSVSLVEAVDPQAIQVSIEWGTGYCTLVQGPAARGDKLPLDERRRPCDGGEFPPTQVDPVVHVFVRHDGQTYTSRSVLPLSRLGKTGGGYVPETAWFSVPLTVDVDEVRMCGEGLRAPCSRIEGLGTAGSVLLRVDWTEGATNGRSDWHIGELQSERVEHERPAQPQVNFLQHDLEVVDVAARGGPVTVRYLLHTDRPVDYEVTLTGTCTVEGEEMTRTGTSPGRVSLTWRACPGEAYHLTGTFTDDDGVTATYDSTSPWAALSHTTMPTYDTRLAVGIRAEHTGASAWEGPNTQLATLALRIDGQRVDLGIEPRTCLSRPVIDKSAGVGLRDVALSQHVRVEVSVLMVEAWGSYGGDAPPVCQGANTWHVPTVDLVADVTLDDLREGATLTWEGDTEYAVTLTLQDHGPGA